MDRPLEKVQNTIRLPVYTATQHRPGFYTPGGTPQLWEQAYINCWPQVTKDEVTGEPVICTVKRPGIKDGPVLTATIGSLGTASTMECRANIAISGLTDVFVGAWWDSTASKIYIVQYRPSAATTTKIGEITTATGTDLIFISEITQQVGGTYPAGTPTPAIAVSYQKGDQTLGAGYYAISAGGVFTAASLTAIGSGSFPSNLGTPKVITGPFQQMNGISYIMTLEGTIYASGGSSAVINDITLWNTNSISAASQYPDTALGVYRYKSHIVAFGKDSIEFFNDANLPPPQSPLERMDQAFIKFGAAAPHMVKMIDDTLYWVSFSSTNTIGIWKLDGYTPVKISTKKIDVAISVSMTSPAAMGPQSSLECILLNYKKHLILNIAGFNAYRTVANGDNGTIFSAADTYAITGSKHCAANILAYAIESKIWWGLGIPENETTLVSIMPATSFGQLAATGIATQYLFLSRHNAGTSSGTLLYQVDNFAGDETYLDAVGGGDSPVTAVVQFNTYWFASEKRKRINKAKVITNRVVQTAADTNVYKMYI